MDTLTVHGYDAQGNHFSSLEGLSFDWTVYDPDILKPGKLQDTAGFKVSPVRKAIEGRNRFSDQIVVWGRKTGKTKVSVGWKGGATAGSSGEEGVKKGIQSSDVALTISENLELVPSWLRTMRGAEIE